MNEVHRKVAIVTGAARGIGKATSSRLKREGITVIYTDILLDLECQEAAEKSQSDFKNQSLIHDVAKIDSSQMTKALASIAQSKENIARSKTRKAMAKANVMKGKILKATEETFGKSLNILPI